MASASDTRGAYEDLAAWYAPAAAIVFGLVVLALLAVALRRRATSSARDSHPPLEIAYAVLLGLVAGVLLWRSYDAISDGDAGTAAATAFQPAPPGALTIGVVASRWNWRFTYPGGVAVQGDGRTRAPVLVVPAGEPVRFRLRSADVVHALWIPALRAKYDAVPGRVNTFALRFRPGLDYSTARCSEFCGDFHDQMRFGVDVRPRAQFDAWLRRARAGT